MTGPTRLIYVAWPIDAPRDDAAAAKLDGLVDYAEGRIAELGATAYLPGNAFTTSPQAVPNTSIYDINSVALSKADAVLAFLPSGQVSFGVPTEVAWAVRAGKPTVLFGSERSWSQIGLSSDSDVYAHQRFDQADSGAVNLAIQWLLGRVAERKVDVQHEPLPVKVLEENPSVSLTPRRAYADDAGLDLIVSQHTTIEPGTFVDVPCGVAVELPSWSWGLILPRSSTLRTKRLVVQPSVIDAGWRGPMFVGCQSMSGEPVHLHEGDRVAQLIVMDNLTRAVQPVLVDELSPSLRGENGFGSTGS